MCLYFCILRNMWKEHAWEKILFTVTLSMNIEEVHLNLEMLLTATESTDTCWVPLATMFTYKQSLLTAVGVAVYKHTYKWMIASKTASKFWKTRLLFAVTKIWEKICTWKCFDAKSSLRSTTACIIYFLMQSLMVPEGQGQIIYYICLQSLHLENHWGPGPCSKINQVLKN